MMAYERYKLPQDGSNFLPCQMDRQTLVGESCSDRVSSMKVTHYSIRHIDAYPQLQQSNGVVCESLSYYVYNFV